MKRGLVFGIQCSHDTVACLSQLVGMHGVMEMKWTLTNNLKRLSFKQSMLSREGVKEQ